MNNFSKGFSITTGVLIALAVFVVLAAALCCCVLLLPLLVDPTVQNTLNSVAP